MAIFIACIPKLSNDSWMPHSNRKLGSVSPKVIVLDEAGRMAKLHFYSLILGSPLKKFPGMVGQLDSGFKIFFCTWCALHSDSNILWVHNIFCRYLENRNRTLIWEGSSGQHWLMLPFTVIEQYPDGINKGHNCSHLIFQFQVYRYFWKLEVLTPPPVLTKYSLFSSQKWLSSRDFLC